MNLRLIPMNQDSALELITAWNQRAQKATMKNGFHEESRFFAKDSGMEFVIFGKEAL